MTAVTQSNFFWLFSLKWAYSCCQHSDGSFSWPGEECLLQQNHPASREWESAHARRQNESTLLRAVSLRLSQTTGMNSCEWTPSTVKQPSWKRSAFLIPLLEKVFVHVLSLLAYVLFPFSYLPCFPSPPQKRTCYRSSRLGEIWTQRRAEQQAHRAGASTDRRQNSPI